MNNYLDEVLTYVSLSASRTIILVINLRQNCLDFQPKYIWIKLGCREGLVGKVPGTQAWRSEFRLHPPPQKNWLWHCVPTIPAQGRVGQVGPIYSLKQWGPSSMSNSLLENMVESQREILNVNQPLASTCTNMDTHTYTQNVAGYLHYREPIL